MTMRLSIISLAGIARTLVAVGTSNDADMFFTTAAAAPRNTCASSPSAGGFCAAGCAGFALAGATSTLAAGGCVVAGGASFFAGAVSAFAGAGLAGSLSFAGAPAPLPAAAGFGAGAGPGSRGAVGAEADCRLSPSSRGVAEVDPEVDSGE